MSGIVTFSAEELWPLIILLLGTSDAAVHPKIPHFFYYVASQCLHTIIARFKVQGISARIGKKAL